MSKTMRDSLGNYWEIFDDGFVSKNGDPFGQLNSFNEIHSFDGSEVYVINIHGQIVRLSDDKVVGRFIHGDYLQREGDNRASGSGGPTGGVFPGGGCCGVFLLMFSAVGALCSLGVALFTVCFA